MPYNILQVRTAEAPPDPFYPVILKKGDSVRMVPADGPNNEKFTVSTVGVGEAPKGGSQKKLGSFGGGAVVHTVVLTDVRLIVLSPNFKTGDASLALWGMPNLYLASAALAKLKTHNRALVGHVPLCCIDRVSVLGTGSKHHHNAVRVYVSEWTDSSRRRLYLQLTLQVGADPRPISQAIIRRVAALWLSYGDGESMGSFLSDELRARLDSLTRGPLLESKDREWVGQDMPAKWTLSQKTLQRIGMA